VKFRRSSLGRAAAGLVLTVLVSACGSVTAAKQATARQQVAGDITGPGLATSFATGSDGWAVVEMGGMAAREDNFWELFARPRGGRWQLATPPGVASNGGIVAATAMTGPLVTAFRPSQDLTFSPLAATVDAGRRWAQGNVLDAGLADVPAALAASQAGDLLALTERGAVDQGAALGSRWRPLTSLIALKADPAVKAVCRLSGLTAVAWSAAGSPVLGGGCRARPAGPARPARQAGPLRVPLLTDPAGSWQVAGPALPDALARGPVRVLALGTTGAGITAVVAAGAGPAASVLAAWSADGGRRWTISPALRAGPVRLSSVSALANGSAGVVMAGGRAAVIGWRAARWRDLPSLPAGTGTLAAGNGGVPQALVPRGGLLSVWQLAAARRWTLVQTVRVTIPYGSSG
jgi:hypothetical protein